MHPFKAIIFDNDGVVVDSESLWFEATQKLFREFGVELQHRDIEAGIGSGARYVEDPMHKYGIQEPLEDLIDKRKHYFWELSKSRLRLFPGFLPLLAFAKGRGLKTALASSASTKTVHHSLQCVGVELSDFDWVVDSSSIARKKPFPDIFLNAAQLLQVAPADCLVIEDAPAGVMAAKAAGMTVAAVTTTFEAGRLVGADWIFPNLEAVQSKLSGG